MDGLPNIRLYSGRVGQRTQAEVAWITATIVGRLRSRTGGSDVEKTTNSAHGSTITRRAFVRQGTLFLAGSSFVLTEVSGLAEEDEKAQPKLRIGLVTDLHYADKPPLIHRYYRETPAKFAEAAKQFRRDKTDLVIELGDLIDVGDSLEIEQSYLKRIVRTLGQLPASTTTSWETTASGG